MMKKILAALILAALVVPAMADTTITATDNGNQQLLISFSGPADAVRGIALTITVSNGTIDSFISSDFNTFVDFAHDTAGYEVDMAGQHPFALVDAAGKMDPQIAADTPVAISVGYLDQAGTKLGLTSGSVALIQLGIASGDATVTIEANAKRGGAAVGDDLGTVTITTPSVTVAGGEVPPVITGTLAVAGDGYVNIAAESFTASGVSVDKGDLEYGFDWGDGSAVTWGAATQTHTYSFTVATTYTISVTARATLDNTVTTGPATTTSVTEAYKSSASNYAYWVTFGRPACWAFQKQCNGDANGAPELKKPVLAKDLSILLAAYNKADADLMTIVVNSMPGICADFNHAAELGKKVLAKDLKILLDYYNVADASVPTCDSSTVNYWTN